MKNGLYDMGVVTIDAASATRFLSNATGATWTLTNTTTVDGLAHKVVIHNDTANDHSAKTALLTGTDANGNALTETLNLPAGSGDSTSTKYFKTLTSVVPSATIGADTMDIGIAAAARTPWVRLDPRQVPMCVGLGVAIGGTINYDVLVTFDATPDGDSVVINHNSIVNETTSQHDGLLYPVEAVCVDINSHTSGTVNFHVRQGGRI